MRGSWSRARTCPPTRRSVPRRRRPGGRRCGGSDLPVIAAGDLNAEPGDPTWAAVADGLHIAGTAPTHPASGPRRAIDGVFVDKRIEVASFRVIDTPTARRASDHLPIAVDLVIPDN